MLLRPQPTRKERIKGILSTGAGVLLFLFLVNISLKIFVFVDDLLTKKMGSGLFFLLMLFAFGVIILLIIKEFADNQK
jgi:hypothetical protein